MLKINNKTLYSHGGETKQRKTEVGIIKHL